MNTPQHWMVAEDTESHSAPLSDLDFQIHCLAPSAKGVVFAPCGSKERPAERTSSGRTEVNYQGRPYNRKSLCGEKSITDISGEIEK